MPAFAKLFFPTVHSGAERLKKENAPLQERSVEHICGLVCKVYLVSVLRLVKLLTYEKLVMTVSESSTDTFTEVFLKVSF